MGKPVEPPSGDGVEDIDLRAALEERYLAYALSTIMHRALPDARYALVPAAATFQTLLTSNAIDAATA